MCRELSQVTIQGLHLTQIGSGDFLLEPARSLNIQDQGELIVGVVARLMQARATRLYYDLSSVQLIDPLYYSWLDALARAALTANVRMVCVNMQPAAAFALAGFLGQMPVFSTALDIHGRK
jgi:rsbT antagonist protein RsbS